MVDVDEVIDMLAAGRYVQPVKVGRAAVTNVNVQVVPTHSDTLVEGARGESASVFLVDPGDSYVVGRVALVHETIVLQLRPLLNNYLGDAIVEVGVVPEAYVALDDGRL